MRSSSCSRRSRMVLALGFLVVLVAVTGCGSVAHGVRVASVDTPHDLTVTRPHLTVSRPGTSPSPERAGFGDGSDTTLAAPAADRSSVPDAAAGAASGATPSEADATRIATVAAETAAEATADTTAGDGTAALPAGAADGTVRLAQGKAGADEDEYEVEDYDPWERFNEKMFDFNYKLDRHVVKPVAKVYDRIVPDEVQRMIANAFDNVSSVSRMVNSLLEGKWDGAVRELSRFLLNTTVGVGGLFDVAKSAEIAKSRADFGLTLGTWGVGAGPYLVLPFLEPMTVRDGIGRGVDTFLDPLYWVSIDIPIRIAMKLEDVVNERSLNLELFQGFEETVIDLYSAVRHAYLERRRNLLKQ